MYPPEIPNGAHKGIWPPAAGVKNRNLKLNKSMKILHIFIISKSWLILPLYLNIPENTSKYLFEEAVYFLYTSKLFLSPSHHQSHNKLNL